MNIDETPILPLIHKYLEKYLKSLSLNTDYKAYSIDGEFNIIEGIGTIESNGSWNYHNNYDDSEDTLFFKFTNKYGHKIRGQKWWTLNKEEAEKVLAKEKSRVIKILENRIKKLKK